MMSANAAILAYLSDLIAGRGGGGTQTGGEQEGREGGGGGVAKKGVYIFSLHLPQY